MLGTPPAGALSKISWDAYLKATRNAHRLRDSVSNRAVFFRLRSGPVVGPAIESLRLCREDGYSKVEFQRNLYKSRRTGFNHLPESSGAEVAVNRRRTKELRVIESIERLQSKLDGLAFVEHKIPKEREIEVQGAWSIKRPPGRRTRRAQCVGRE